MYAPSCSKLKCVALHCMRVYILSAVGCCSVTDELYRCVISSHEDKYKQLIVENQELRQVLCHVLVELDTLLRDRHGQPLKSCDQHTDEVCGRCRFSRRLQVISPALNFTVCCCHERIQFKITVLTYRVLYSDIYIYGNIESFTVTHHGIWGRSSLLLMSVVVGHCVLPEPIGWLCLQLD